MTKQFKKAWEKATVKKSDNFSDMMAWEDGSLSNEDTTALFQRLIDSGQAWSLQGMYGRQAEALIEAGYCHDSKGHPRHGTWVPGK